MEARCKQCIRGPQLCPFDCSMLQSGHPPIVPHGCGPRSQKAFLPRAPRATHHEPRLHCSSVSVETGSPTAFHTSMSATRVWAQGRYFLKCPSGSCLRFFEWLDEPPRSAVRAGSDGSLFGSVRLQTGFQTDRGVQSGQSTRKTEIKSR